MCVDQKAVSVRCLSLEVHSSNSSLAIEALLYYQVIAICIQMIDLFWSDFWYNFFQFFFFTPTTCSKPTLGFHFFSWGSKMHQHRVFIWDSGGRSLARALGVHGSTLNQVTTKRCCRDCMASYSMKMALFRTTKNHLEPGIPRVMHSKQWSFRDPLWCRRACFMRWFLSMSRLQMPLKWDLAWQ